ncbi:serine/threonine protein kinase, CMGC, CDC2/CDK sub [Blastocladiella emersonii ATCC 22665]|nr:serine/threonine protein kinase, CMGC, CDC2/CDK sub [Blastocladiella emersonii ATCC 22665]
MCLYSEVSKGTSRATGEIVALKRLLLENENEGLPITAMREIKLLKRLKHPNVVDLVDVVTQRDSNTKGKMNVFMVFPYLEHDLSGYARLAESHVTVRLTQSAAITQSTLEA